MDKGELGVNSETLLDAGVFEVLRPGVTMSGLEHIVDPETESLAKMPLETGEILVIKFPKGSNTMQYVQAALRLAGNGAEKGNISITGEENGREEA